MKKLRTIFFVTTFALIIYIAACLLYFNGELNAHRDEDIGRLLQDSVAPNAVSFALQMDGQVKKVRTFADFLGDNWDMPQEMQTSLLRAAVENNDLLRCAIAFPDGSFITHDGKNDGNVTNDAFFQANMRGEFFITDPRSAVVDAAKTVILFAAPIFDQGGQVVGSVIYSYQCKELEKIFNLKSMDGQMSLVVIKQSGELIIGRSPYTQQGGDLLGDLARNCTHRGHEAATCCVVTGDQGTFIVSPADAAEPLYVRYEKLDQNDWYMLAGISESGASASIAFATRNQQMMSVSIACGVVVYTMLLLLLGLMKSKLTDRDSGAGTLYAFKRQSKKILAARKSQRYVVVLLDIKDFKLINRIHTYAVGDQVIRGVAQALRAVLPEDDATFARIGVDNFLLLLPYEGRKALDAQRQRFIETFRQIIDQPFCTKIAFPTGQYVLKESDFPKPDIDEIFEKVNFAHRAAKRDSDLIIDYEEDIEHAALFEKTVEDRMEQAIANKEFTLYLQPKIRLDDERICGAEALVRWKVGDQYFMYPTDFIPVFERNGFIVQLDFYMFECAAEFIRRRMDQGGVPLPISVNFSRHHLDNDGFVAELCRIADRYHVPHRYLEIEITESAFLGHTHDMKALIDTAHEAGFLIAMDDFGSGYSCFAQLKDLEIDVLKLDRGFFGKNADQARARTIISGIIDIARELGITTVAEGVETAEHVDMLMQLHCDIIQGYYYARPIPAEQLDPDRFEVLNEERV